jgi:hypothetical protein
MDIVLPYKSIFTECKYKKPHSHNRIIEHGKKAFFKADVGEIVFYRYHGKHGIGRITKKIDDLNYQIGNHIINAENIIA